MANVKQCRTDADTEAICELNNNWCNLYAPKTSTARHRCGLRRNANEIEYIFLRANWVLIKFPDDYVLIKHIACASRRRLIADGVERERWSRNEIALSVLWNSWYENWLRQVGISEPFVICDFAVFSFASNSSEMAITEIRIEAIDAIDWENRRRGKITCIELVHKLHTHVTVSTARYGYSYRFSLQFQFGFYSGARLSHPTNYDQVFTFVRLKIKWIETGRDRTTLFICRTIWRN